MRVSQIAGHALIGIKPLGRMIGLRLISEFWFRRPIQNRERVAAAMFLEAQEERRQDVLLISSDVATSKVTDVYTDDAGHFCNLLHGIRV